MIRQHMEANEIDACVFTSYHNVHYFSDFLYCYFGRPYAFIVTANKAMSVSAGKDVLIKHLFKMVRNLVHLKSCKIQKFMKCACCDIGGGTSPFAVA